MQGDVPTTDDPQEKRVGSYRLVRPLGAGGMSSVFQAVHVDSEVDVALKILPRGLARNPTLLQRFLREADSAEALQHPNIVAIYDRGVDRGRHYLVLEYIAGGDLHDWVRQNGPMPPALAATVVRSVAKGLLYAAGRGVIHRDVKPANLLMTPGGEIKITDLGLALQAESEDQRVTREGTTVGTVDYMAPEQARDSRGTSLRSDIYSLGCTLYYLTTGQAPYPGGDIADKLNRHCNGPVPDPRAVRPEIPEPLAALTRRMMAKRPEARFQDYEGLIAALDRIEAPPSSAQPETVDAPPAGRPPESPTLDALFADDEDGGDDVLDGFQPLTLPGTSARDWTRPPSNGGELELAALADADPAPSIRPGPASALEPPRPILRTVSTESSRVSEARTRPAEPDPDLDPDEGQDAVPYGPTPRRGESSPDQAWVVRCAVAGVLLVALVIGGDVLLRRTGPAPEAPPQGEPGVVAVADDLAPPAVAPSPDRPPLVVAARPAVTNSARPAVAVPRTELAASWVEPLDPESAVEHDPPGLGTVPAEFRPERLGRAARPGSGKSIVVRRLQETRSPVARSTLASALEESGGGRVEIAGDGPFFEDDWRIVGDARTIAARPGFRPIICLTAPKPTVLGGQTALIDLKKKSVEFHGIDFIVDASQIPGTITSIFACRGASLTLDRCTVTVLPRAGVPLNLIALADDDPGSTLLLDRSAIRGSIGTLVDFGKGIADLMLDHCVVFNGRGSLANAAGVSGGARRVFVVRSVVATSGPAYEFTDPPRGFALRKVTLRAFGSTFAQFETAAPSSLIHWLGAGGPTRELLDWHGEANDFQGWRGWLTTGKPPAVRVVDLAAARQTWSGTDPTSRETASGWPVPQRAERVRPIELSRELDTSRTAFLRTAAAPSPWLFEKTVEPFPRPSVPGPEVTAPPDPASSQRRLPGFAAVSPITEPKVAGVNASIGSGIAPVRPAPTGGALTPPPTPSVPTVAGQQDLSFSTQAAPWSGDLGRYLFESVRPGTHLVKVRVSGSGRHVFTPVRLPAGVALELTVEPAPDGSTPWWEVAADAGSGPALESRSGGLSLKGLRLEREGSSRPGPLVRVEAGHLLVRGCRLATRGPAEPGAGGLLAFVSAGSEPVKVETGRPATWPFGVPVGRPTCRVLDSVLIAAGDALDAELGRGMAAFQQCAIVAEDSAFSLRPGLVARATFDADLVIESCTVVAGLTFVRLGAWPGSDPGPDRPWVVHTSHSAFLGAFDKASGESVLLRADPEAFARGVLFWQGSGDALEAGKLLAATDYRPSATSSGNRRQELRQWVELWGPVRPRPLGAARGRDAPPTARLGTRLRPGGVKLEDLRLDPKFAPGPLGVDHSRFAASPIFSDNPDR